MGDPPIPMSATGLGGLGMGDPPIPMAATGLGGFGMGDPPIPATLLRIEAPTRTTSIARENVRKKFFTTLLQFEYVMLEDKLEKRLRRLRAAVNTFPYTSPFIPVWAEAVFLSSKC